MWDWTRCSRTESKQKNDKSKQSEAELFQSKVSWGWSMPRQICEKQKSPIWKVWESNVKKLKRALPLGAVHKLRLQEEGGRWSKKSTFCKPLYHRKCKRRGVGGQKNKSCKRSLWTPPYLFKNEKIYKV